MSRHRQVALWQIMQALDKLGGYKGLKSFIRPDSHGLNERVDCDASEYGDLTLGEVRVIFDLLVTAGGPDVLTKLCEGNATVRVKAVENPVRKRIVNIYDRNGRFIVPKGFSGRNLDADRSCKFVLPDDFEWGAFNFSFLNPVDRFDRIRPFVSSDCGITLPTREEIIRALVYSEEVRVHLKNDEASKNILRGANLPTILPKCAVADNNKLVASFLEIAKRSYEDQFPGRMFSCGPQENSSFGKILIAPESRFQKIREQMSTEFVSGITFFTPFQGYSVPASRRAMGLLPKECALSCFDTIWDWIIYPDILLSSQQAPGQSLSGFYGGSGSDSLFGKGGDDCADFGGGILLANPRFSSGLFFQPVPFD